MKSFFWANTSYGHIRNLCRAFDAWDKFDHQTAIGLLEVTRWKEKGTWIFKGKKILNAVKNPEPYQILQDLLLNADRCQVQGRFDDGVARLYRSLELFAQIRLKTEYGIDAGDISLDKLPEGLREKYQARKKDKEKIEVSLVEGYTLLAELGDYLGLAWLKKEKKLMGILKTRNNSILAHGLEPIDRVKYEKFIETVIPFIESGLKKLNITVDKEQFPTIELLNA